MQDGVLCIAYLCIEWYTFTANDYLYTPPSASTSNPNWLHIPRDANHTTFQSMTDTGADLIRLPTSMADFFAAQFIPAAHSFTDTEYKAPCNAQVPGFAVKIGGVIFPVDKRDLLFDAGLGGGMCQIGIGNAMDLPPYILGTNFLTNVVAVHDVGKLELRFASRLVS